MPSAHVDARSPGDRPTERRRIDVYPKDWFGCLSCGNVWPQRLTQVDGTSECSCQFDWDDPLHDVGVGPRNHQHSTFLSQSSSPFWKGEPDQDGPDYCAEDPDNDVKAKRPIGRWEHWYDGKPHAYSCPCGIRHIVPSREPVCPYDTCRGAPLRDLGLISSVEFCRSVQAYARRINFQAQPPAPFLGMQDSL